MPHDGGGGVPLPRVGVGAVIHPSDWHARNPRMQCDSCGRWSRVYLKDGKQFSYGRCGVTEGDHTAAGPSQDVCESCCRTKCGLSKETS